MVLDIEVVLIHNLFRVQDLAMLLNLGILYQKLKVFLSFLRAAKLWKNLIFVQDHFQAFLSTRFYLMFILNDFQGLLACWDIFICMIFEVFKWPLWFLFYLILITIFHNIKLKFCYILVIFVFRDGLGRLTDLSCEEGFKYQFWRIILVLALEFCVDRF